MSDFPSLPTAMTTTQSAYLAAHSPVQPACPSRSQSTVPRIADATICLNRTQMANVRRRRHPDVLSHARFHYSQLPRFQQVQNGVLRGHARQKESSRSSSACHTAIEAEKSAVERLLQYFWNRNEAYVLKRFSFATTTH